MRPLLVLQVDLGQLSFSADGTSGKSSCPQRETFFLSIDLWVTFSLPAALMYSFYTAAAPFPQPITTYVLRITQLPEAVQAPPLATAARLVALS